ncbi:MAG TPA: 4Fe-4S binding protein [Sedimentisphaerales bacterium]|jgi:SAM-dependent methyltransferase|nr:4Fe-4S binding protein [Sedimentisphaerales bacterium]HNU30652.1 4Fe-4S binding protein [Sedimentisphaerales bacterium]
MQFRASLAFCWGLLAVAIQVLLMREVGMALAGGDLWVGAFLGTWFLGGALGAFLFRGIRDRLVRLGPAAELFLLAPVPVSYLQYLAVVLLASVGPEPGSVPSVQEVLGWSLLIFSPGGVATGLFFPTLCARRAEKEQSFLIAVCIWGVAGGVFGGLAAAFLPFMGMNTIQILMTLAVLLCAVSAWHMCVRRPSEAKWIRVAAGACLLVVLAVAVLRADIPLTRALQEQRWSRSLSGGTLDGSFRTQRGLYLYGADGRRWGVVGPSGTCEVVGDTMQAGKVAALALSQNFNAERVLVVGDGLAVCERFLLSGSVKGVDWFCPDREYIQAMTARLPERFRVSDPRLHYVTDDIRTTLAASPRTYDVVIVNLPSVVDASLHHLASTEFLEQVKQSLRPLGVLVMGIAGDRNLSGGEPAYQGAWAGHTLDAVFSRSLLVPLAERTFFVCSAGGSVEVSPIGLETRFGLVENAGEIFPVELLCGVYRPEQSLKMLSRYDAVELPAARLVNSDAKPSYGLCSLLQAMDRSGLPLVKPVRLLFRGGLTVVIVPILLFAVMRLVYIVRTAPRARERTDHQDSEALRSDSLLLCGCAAAVGAIVLVLLVRAWLLGCGALPQCVGLAFSLFLGGSAFGALCAQWAVSRLPPKGPAPARSMLLALGALLAIHVVCLVASGLVLDHPAPWAVFSVLLFVYGFFSGATMVLGGKVLEGCGEEATLSATCLGGASYLGGALGGLAGLFLIGLMGFHAVLWVAAALALGEVFLAGTARHDLLHPGKRVVTHPVLTPAGYGLLAVALSLIICSHVLGYRERAETRSQATVAVQDWIQGRRLSAGKVVSTVTSKEATYHEVRENSQLKGYIFRSEDFSSTVYGYGGPMSVIVFADPCGTLIDFRITRSRETPRYISRIRDWMASLKGRNVFGPTPVQGVNAVSGATLSCNAILRLLRTSGPQFDASALSGARVADAVDQGWLQRVNWLVVYWAAGILLALVAIHHGRLWSRLAVLAFTAGVGGFWLNRQYSTDHVIRLLSGQGLLDSPIVAACLLLGVPLIVLLLGNIYCGYLCPFGAVQELLSLVLPRRFKARPCLSMMTAARFLKYAVLFVVVVAFFWTGSTHFPEMDPLTLVFNRQFWSDGFFASPGLITVVVVLLGALIVTRMWCRYLCPTGAFLSLFNAAGWLGRFLPAKKFGRCEFGLSGRDRLDCIHCDRCRYESRLIPTRDDVVAKTRPSLGSWAFLSVVLCLAGWTLAPVFRRPPTAAASLPAALAESKQGQTQNPFPMRLRSR